MPLLSPRPWQLYPKAVDVPLMLGCSACLLIFGLFLPVITLKELVFWTHTFSVITGIENLFLEDHYILGGIILLFSIIFPIFKLGILSMVWFGKLSEHRRKFYLYWLGVLGKWSMLDVFVVAMMIVITKISGFAKAEAHSGIYFFGGSVILAMILAERIERLLQKSP